MDLGLEQVHTCYLQKIYEPSNFQSFTTAISDWTTCKKEPPQLHPYSIKNECQKEERKQIAEK